MDVLGSPADQLSPASSVDQDWRAISGGVCDGPPDLLAGAAVEGHVRTIGHSGMNDDAVAVDHRRAGEPPFGHLGVVRLDEVLRPKELAGRGLETVEVADSAERIDAAVVHGRSGAGPVVVAAQIAVLRRVTMLPDNLAIGGVEA